MGKYKGLLDMIVICVWFLGTIGGFGYLWYYEQYVIAIAVIGVGIEASYTLWDSLRYYLPKKFVDWVERNDVF